MASVLRRGLRSARAGEPAAPRKAAAAANATSARTMLERDENWKPSIGASSLLETGPGDAARATRTWAASNVPLVTQGACHAPQQRVTAVTASGSPDRPSGCRGRSDPGP